jgi:hypothetical protein
VNTANLTPDETERALTVSKLLTVIELPGDEVRVELRADHFTTFTDEARRTIVSNLLNDASAQITLESERLAKETPDNLTPRNGGSLYDDIVFELSIYASQGGDVVLNLTFGRAVEDSLPHHFSNAHVAAVLAFMGNKFSEGDLNLPI